MKSRLLLCGLLLFMVLLPSVGQGQTSYKILKGIQGIKLVIEPPEKEGTDCGITEQGIRQAVMFPASSTNLNFLELGSGASLRSGAPYYYVNVTTAKSEYVCASSVGINVYYIKAVKLPNYPRVVVAKVVLWEKGFVTFAHPTQHGKQIRDVIEDLTKEFLIDWNLDNK